MVWDELITGKVSSKQRRKAVRARERAEIRHQVWQRAKREGVSAVVPWELTVIPHQQPEPGPVDKVRACAAAWAAEDAEVAARVRSGCAPQWLEHPPPYRLKEYELPPDQNQFRFDRIMTFWQTGIVVRVQEPPYIISPLFTVPKGDTWRLIHDLTVLNAFIKPMAYELEGIEALARMCSRTAWAVGVDISQAFDHVLAAKEFRPFLGMAVRDQQTGDVWYFVYRALPMGLSSTPAFWALMFAVVVKRWKQPGVQVHTYVDDVRAVIQYRPGAEDLAQQIQKDLARFGLASCITKCEYEPSRRFVSIGFDIDMENHTIRISPKRRKKIMGALEVARSARGLSKRQVASLLGKVVSCRYVLGTDTKMFCREMAVLLRPQGDWDVSRDLSPGFLIEVQHWIRVIGEGDGPVAPLTMPAVGQTLVVPHFIATMDASANGMGATLIAKGIPQEVAATALAAAHVDRSSTFRELLGIAWFCVTFVEKLRGKACLLFTDNRGAASIMAYGSGVHELNELARTLVQYLRGLRIRLTVRWLPREVNVFADELSRFAERYDRDDYYVTDRWYNIICKRAGLSVDWDAFAGRLNCKVQNYCSMFKDSDRAVVNAFAQSWAHRTPYVFAPPDMVGEFIPFLKGCRAAILVVPEWKDNAGYQALLSIVHSRRRKGGRPQFREGVKFLSASRCGDVMPGPVGRANHLIHTRFIAVRLDKCYWEPRAL